MATDIFTIPKDLKSAFENVCNFCRSYNKSEPLTSNSEETEEVRESLTTLQQWAEEEFSSYEGIPFKVRVTFGSGNFPRVPWLALLPPKQEVSDGVYFVICFGREGAGAIAGCATSVTTRTSLETVKRSKNKPLKIDVNGDSVNTRYNDAFSNPIELTPDNFDEESLKEHIIKSLEAALRYIQSLQNSAPEVSEQLDVASDSASQDDEAESEQTDSSDNSKFDTNNVEDARRKILASIKQRQGQSKFRKGLLKAYKSRCAITGCDIPAVLEAAHIMPYKGTYTNHITNGLLLRADLHTLFDLNLIAVDPDTLTVIIAPALSGTEYGTFAGKQITMPGNKTLHPNKEALAWRRVFLKL